MSNIDFKKLGDYVKIRRSALSDIENGKQPMREVHLRKLTAFFDVTSDYLLGYSSTGIGIYFDGSEDDNDHAYISGSELEMLKERYEVKEQLLNKPNAETWVIRTSVYENTIYNSTHILFRSVNISKEKAEISTSLREQVISKINSYDVRKLEKLLKFMKEYIED